MPTLDDLANRKLGPNMRRFVTYKMALLATPPGTKDPLAAGIVSILNIAESGKHWREAVVWCCAAVDAVKSAPDNPHGDDDEAIAGVILAGIKARQDEQLRSAKR